MTIRPNPRVIMPGATAAIGFRVAAGFAERVIFRELFPRGLTLLDLRDIGTAQLSMSNIAARQELRDLVTELRLPGVNAAF